VNINMVDICVQTCTTPNAGRGNCRAGYVCQTLTHTATMQTLPFGFCFPACTSGLDCTSGSCNFATGYCN
jgi:hypothetical protein